MTNSWFPRFNRQGEVASGYGEIWCNERVVLAPGFKPHWFDDNTIIALGAGDNVWKVQKDGSSPETISQSPAFNTYGAGGGNWAAAVHGNPRTVAIEFDPVTGVKLMLVEYGGVNEDRSIFYGDIPVIEHSFVIDARACNGHVVWRQLPMPSVIKGWKVDRRVIEDLRSGDMWEGNPIPIQTPKGPWFSFMTNVDIRIRPWDSTVGYIIPIGENANLNHDAVGLGSVIRVAWQDDQGNGAQRDISLSAPRVNVGSVSQPGEPTQPAPVANQPRLRAFSHFGWVTTYFGVGKYGDTPDPIGNCTLFVEWKNDQNQQMLVRDLERLVTPGSRHVRLIIHGDGPSEIPERFINQTVAWWCSGGNIDELGAAVERCRRRPERPILAYLDGRGWPESKPVWLDGRVRANAQLYRFPNEPMDQFTGQCSVMMQRLRSYGQLFGASARFDDFNGDGSVQQTIECMPFYEFAIREYLLVDWLMFADRRQGVKNGRPIGGMNLYPELRAWGSAFDYAFPETPNRFNYWTPNGVDMWTQIENLFGQSRLAVGLESRHRRFLLALKGTAPSDPVDPPPVDPVDPPSNGDSSPDTSALAAFVVDRWKALGVPQQTAAIADRFPYRDEDDDDFKKAQDAASEPEFRALQAGAFHKIIGEWYWSRLSDTVKVMLVPKTGGTNHNNLAEDTFVIGVPDRWLWYADAIQACGHRAAQPKPGYSMTKSGEPNRWAVPPRP